MSSAPQNTNAFVAFVNRLISKLTTGVAAPIIEAAAELEVPELKLPIVKQIFEGIVDYAAGKLSIAEQQGVLTIVFSVQSDDKLYSVISATKALQDAQKSGQGVEDATKKAVEQWGNLIHFGGIAPVSK